MHHIRESLLVIGKSLAQAPARNRRLGQHCGLCRREQRQYCGLSQQTSPLPAEGAWALVLQSPTGSATALHRLALGFTAIELMVVVLLVAIITALALPSFDWTFKRYRVSTAASEIANTLQFTRMEAIRGRNQTVMAQTTNPDPGCTTGANTDWHCGIDVFDDTNNDMSSSGARDTGYATLKTISTTNFSGLNVQSSNQNIVYTPLGFFLNNTTGGYIYVWPSIDGTAPETASYVNTICLGAGGGVNVFKYYINSCPD
jgi:type IV fimbrial biogenesis protein FimT